MFFRKQIQNKKVLVMCIMCLSPPTLLRQIISIMFLCLFIQMAEIV